MHNSSKYCKRVKVHNASEILICFFIGIANKQQIFNFVLGCLELELISMYACGFGLLLRHVFLGLYGFTVIIT